MAFRHEGLSHHSLYITGLDVICRASALPHKPNQVSGYATFPQRRNMQEYHKTAQLLFQQVADFYRISPELLAQSFVLKPQDGLVETSN
jgi:hypothetical protein